MITNNFFDNYHRSPVEFATGLSGRVVHFADDDDDDDDDDDVEVPPPPPPENLPPPPAPPFDDPAPATTGTGDDPFPDPDKVSTPGSSSSPWSLGLNTDLEQGIRADNVPETVDLSIKGDYTELSVGGSLGITDNLSIDTEKGLQAMVGEGELFGAYINPSAGVYDLCVGIGITGGEDLAGASAGVCMGSNVMVFGDADFCGASVDVSYSIDYVGIVTDTAREMFDSFNSYMSNYMRMSNLGNDPY